MFNVPVFQIFFCMILVCDVMSHPKTIFEKMEMLNVAYYSYINKYLL